MPGSDFPYLQTIKFSRRRYRFNYCPLLLPLVCFPRPIGQLGCFSYLLFLTVILFCIYPPPPPSNYLFGFSISHQNHDSLDHSSLAISTSRSTDIFYSSLLPPPIFILDHYPILLPHGVYYPLLIHWYP